MTWITAWSARGMATVVASAAFVAGCREPQDAPPTDVPTPTRRHVAKRGSVRPLPPHAIGRDAVGPYHLDEPMAAILADMPGGPRLNVLELPGVADVRIARVEEGSMLVGGQERSSFIGIVGRDIARTEDGFGIGTPSKQLTAAHAAARDPQVLRSGGLHVLPTLPNLRMISQGTSSADPIIAMILFEGVPTAALAACPPPAIPVTVDVAPPDPAARAMATCLTEAGDMVIVNSQGISHWVVDGGKWRRNALMPLGDIVAAGPLRTAARHDDILVISRTRDVAVVQHVATLWRLEGARFVRGSSEPVYRLDAINAASIGASLAELDLAIEAFVANGQIQLGGALLVRAAGQLRDVVPLLPAYLPLRRRGADIKPTASPGAPGTQPAADAGALAPQPERSLPPPAPSSPPEAPSGLP